MSQPTGYGPKILVAIAIATIVLSIGGAIVAVTWAQSNYAARLKAAEDTAAEARKNQVNKDVYEADQRRITEGLLRIEESLKEIRRGQLREAEGGRRR